MLVKQNTYTLLFGLAYVGALLIEKPIYSGTSVADCFSYLFTLLVHFSLFTLLVVTNRRVLIPYLLEKQPLSGYVVGLLGLLALYIVAIHRYNPFIHQVLFHDRVVQTSAGFWDNLIYALCCSVTTSFLYITQKWSDQQEQVKNIQINQLQTELKYLRSQINPHFLFNGLNTVYGSIEMGNRQARDMLVQFSDLLRYNLYEADVDLIELEREVGYLENYVALQKARSNDNIQVSAQLTYQNGGVKIAPLLFMVFVENAFKYVSRDDTIFNQIGIRLQEEAGRIDFTCENSYEDVESKNGGIGLSNAVRRLDLLYKDRYELAINKDPNLYQVHLTLRT